MAGREAAATAVRSGAGDLHEDSRLTLWIAGFTEAMKGSRRTGSGVLRLTSPPLLLETRKLGKRKQGSRCSSSGNPAPNISTVPGSRPHALFPMWAPAALFAEEAEPQRLQNSKEISASAEAKEE